MADATDRFVLPEFTRSLRGFASHDALGSASHNVVFGPLLAARRSAARVIAPEARVAAFDADRLRRGLMDAIAALAADRAGGDAASRRALEAALEERAKDVLVAIAAIKARAAELRAAAPDANAAAWHVWCDAVQLVFDETDGFWLSIDSVAPPRRGGRGGSAMRSALLIGAALALHAAEVTAQRATVRVGGAQPDSLLAAGFDVVGAEPGGVLVVVSPRDRERLEALGLRPTALAPPRAAVLAGAQATPVVYRSFDDPVRGIRRWIDSLAAANTRISVDTIGRSFEGRPLLLVKIGPRGDAPARPNVLFIATYHAREWAATETALRLVKWLAAPPGTNARRDSLVQARDIWIMPVANPDGYQYTFDTERLWRKTRSPQGALNVGVDMNRNHSVNWAFDNQGSSPDAGSDIYRGPTPASEVETSSIEAFHAAHPPVVAVSYHTFGGLLLYPPGHAYGALPSDRAVYQALAGTHVNSAMADRLPGSNRTQYAPGPAWNLYTTNGEYTDFASSRHGALALTIELTSGYGPTGFYGFEFPDDDALLETLFQDNLPLTLDLLDAARAPAAFVSPTTGRRPGLVNLESVSPDIRATVPAAAASGATVALSTPVTFRIDSAAGGRYLRRLVATEAGRPAAFSITAGGATANFRTLAVSGAESGDPPWAAQGFVRDTVFARAGSASWLGIFGTLESRPVTVPADADTVSLVYWNAHFGNGFSPFPSGKVEVTSDRGQTWSIIQVVRGSAPVWYTDGVTVGAVRGKTLAFRLTADAMPWRLDEIAVVAHGPVTGSVAADEPQVRPSENPVRSDAVRLTWPFGRDAGDLIAYDFSGREIWRRRVDAGATQTWDVGALGVGNGVYIVVARAGQRVTRLKLFVARRSP